MPSTSCWYPLQRHRWADRASRIVSSLGSGSRASSATAAITIPGVQYPHWTAPAARNALCTG